MPTLTFKVTEEEARHIRALAKREKISVSEYLRRQAHPAARSAAPIGRVRCAYTGANIFAPAPDLPPLSTDSVRQILVEFP
jgi:hypothetical protein